MTDARTAETMADDDEPGVLAMGGDLPLMPTEEERRKFEWGARFVESAVNLGVLDTESAQALFLSGLEDWDYMQAPEEALADEISYWENDGD